MREAVAPNLRAPRRHGPLRVVSMNKQRGESGTSLARRVRCATSVSTTSTKLMRGGLGKRVDTLTVLGARRGTSAFVKNVSTETVSMAGPGGGGPLTAGLCYFMHVARTSHGLAAGGMRGLGTGEDHTPVR